MQDRIEYDGMEDGAGWEEDVGEEDVLSGTLVGRCLGPPQAPPGLRLRSPPLRLQAAVVAAATPLGWPVDRIQPRLRQSVIARLRLIYRLVRKISKNKY